MFLGNIKRIKWWHLSGLDYFLFSIFIRKRVLATTKLELKRRECWFYIIKFLKLFQSFRYSLALNSDSTEFGGHNRLKMDQEYHTFPEG